MVHPSGNMTLHDMDWGDSVHTSQQALRKGRTELQSGNLTMY